MWYEEEECIGAFILNEKEMQELIFYLASNATKRITYTSLGKIVGIRHSETVKNYLEYIEQTYMIFQLMKYSPSVKVQMLNLKKIYFIDNAIVSRIGFNATDNPSFCGGIGEPYWYGQSRRCGFGNQCGWTGCSLQDVDACPLGFSFVAVMIWLFAFSSIIGNYYYGETYVRYIKDKKWPVLPCAISSPS